MSATTHKERPILFSGPMVRALLAGRKTQTRRVVKLRPREVNPTLDVQGVPIVAHSWAMAPDGTWHIFCDRNNHGDQARYDSLIRRRYGDGPSGGFPCPYGRVGDRRYVKESAWIAPAGFADIPSDNTHVDHEGRGRMVAYAADDRWGETARCCDDFKIKLTPSIHLPRWASRITLEITGVRVERLQEITEADAIAEGLDSHPCFARPGKMLYRDYALRAYDPFEWYASPVRSYQSLWESINGPGSWERNDWVWVIEFRVVEGGAA